MRVGVGKPRTCESVAEDPSNWGGSAPRGSRQSLGDEPTIFASTDLRRRKKWVVVRKAQIRFQHGQIVADDLERLGTHREKDGGEGLATLGTDLVGVLEQSLRGHVDMLQPQGGKRSVARAGQYGASYYRPVPALDGGARWRESENALDLLECGDSLFAPCRGDADVLF
jgi:hypothetical protein